MYWTGEVLGFESLVYGVFEFVHVLIDTSKFRTTVKSSVNDILYYVILYMQMTDDQVRVWRGKNKTPQDFIRKFNWFFDNLIKRLALNRDFSILMVLLVYFCHLKNWRLFLKQQVGEINICMVELYLEGIHVLFNVSGEAVDQ